MIMFTITKPKRKLKKLFLAAALVLLLAVAVPGAYFTLSDAGAMSLFASGEAVEQPPNAAADAAAAADGQTDENAQPEQAEQTAGAADAAGQAADTSDEAGEDTEDTADTDAAAEPSFWARLRAVFFGEEPQVLPY